MVRDVPHDPNAEAAVIGASLVAPDVALPRIGDLLAEDFMMPSNREAWEAILAAQERGVRIDVLTVGDLVRARGSWDRFEGGWQLWAVAAASNVPQALNVEHYAAIVREKATLRRTILLCEETKLRAHGEDPAEVVLGEARQRFSELEIRGRQQGPIHIGQAISAAVTEIAGRSTAESRHLIPTYLSTLDDYLGGVAPEEVMVVAGRPGMGKTAFADGMLMSAAADAWPCLFFSLEMSMQRLLERILSMRTGIPASHMRTGRDERGQPLDKAVHLRLLKEGGRLEGLPLLIDDRSLTLNQLVAEARRWHARTVAGSGQPMGLVAIDYLQLIGVDDARVDKTREQQVARMSRELKKLAKAIHSPVVLLAQLNREVEKRGGRPMLSDLRESGAIEQDADIIMFIHREGMVGEDQKARNADGPAEVIVAKNRGGAIGIAPAQWLARTMEFVAGDTHHAGYEGPDTKREAEPHWSDGPEGREPQ